MFQTMKKYGLGIEEATRALIVRKSFHREILAGDRSGPVSTLSGVDMKVAVNAIEKLISKVSLDNLLYESDSSSVDMNSDSDEERLSIRPDLRINPLSSGSTAGVYFRTVERKKSNNLKHTNNTNNNAASAKTKIPTNKTTSRSKSQLLSPSLSGRKRKMDDIATASPRDETNKRRGKNNGKVGPDVESTSEHLPSSRPRSDSVSSVVDAKMTAIHPSAASTTVSQPKRPPTRGGGGPTGTTTGSDDDVGSSSLEKTNVSS
jgi:hypothetical protein